MSVAGLERRLRELAAAVEAMDCANSSFVSELAHRLGYAADLVRDYDFRRTAHGYVPPTLPSLDSYLRAVELSAGRTPELAAGVVPETAATAPDRVRSPTLKR